MSKKAIVIGAGFAGISAATTLKTLGFEVKVIEKNEMAGGRARVWKQDGFTFDLGPSWYWMPDVFERYFERFGAKVSDYYQLERLNPSYNVIFQDQETWEVPADLSELKTLLEKYEKGAGEQLDKFLAQAGYKYQVGINDLVYKPSRSVLEFADTRLLSSMLKMDVFQSMHTHIRRFFTHPKIIQLLEFPVLFLGALPKNTPALYSLMNYADIQLGTWYPKGGMHKIIEGMVALAEKKGVEFFYNQAVEEVMIDENKKITSVKTAKTTFEADVVVNGSDYHHFETDILPKKYQSYSEKYWDKRTLAPSCLIYYIGLNKKLENVPHHSLYFDTPFIEHAEQIYETPQWPSEPLFYVSVPSTTDKTVAPEGCENLFFLIPVATDLKDDLLMREKYFDIIIERYEKHIGQKIRENIILRRDYSQTDFKNDYNSFKGNAYGLANTLLQTAILKPSLKSKKIKNLYYTGQLTVPGPGVPPSLISGQVVAQEVAKDWLYR